MPGLPLSLRRGPVAATAIAITAIIASTSVLAAAPARADTASCASSQLQVVAHPDDDLLFQSPDLATAIDDGACVTTAYVTAGDNGEPAGYRLSRETGVEAAYAQMAGVPSVWETSTQTFAGHSVVTATLTGRPGITLLFFRLPDGGLNAEGYASTGFTTLPELDRGSVPSISAVDDSAAYTKAGLIDALRAVMVRYSADVVRTQDYTARYGDASGDHPDHLAVAYFTRSASNGYSAPHTLVGYLDYASAREDANVGPAAVAAKSAAFYAYTPHDHNICQNAAACAGTVEEQWLGRQYTVDSTVFGPAATSTDIARRGTAVASSENTADGQTAAAAIDGVVKGYPEAPSAEWAAQDETVGADITVSWPYEVTTGRVVLHDRPNSDDRITSGVLSFSDGTTVDVPELANDGSATEITFPARTITSARFTIRSVSESTLHPGLAEFEVWTGTASSTPQPTTTPTPTPAPTGTSTPTDTPTPSPTPSDTATPTPTPTPSTTTTPEPTTTPSATPTPTPTPSATGTPAPTASATTPPVPVPPAPGPGTPSPAAPVVAPTAPAAGTPVAQPNPVAPAPVAAAPSAPPVQLPPVQSLPREKGKPKLTIKDSTLTTKQFAGKGASATITGLTPGKRYRLLYAAGDSGTYLGKPVAANAKGTITGTWKPNAKASPALGRTGTFALRIQGVQTSLNIAKTFTVKYDAHLSWRTVHRTGEKVAFAATVTRATATRDTAWTRVAVQLQKRAGRTWKTVAVVRTSSKGVVSTTLKAGRSAWRAVVAPTATTWGATSRTVTK